MKFSLSIVRAVVGLSATSSVLANNGWAGQTFNENEFTHFEQMSVGDRLLDLTKYEWPECMNDADKNNAIACKNHIDSELETMNLTTPIPSVIIWTRHPNSPTFNAIVIPMDENGMCVGRSSDFKLHYPFDWCTEESPKELTPDKKANSRKLIKPSKWTTMKWEKKAPSCTLKSNNGNHYGNDTPDYNANDSKNDKNTAKTRMLAGAAGGATGGAAVTPPSPNEIAFADKISEFQANALNIIGGDFKVSCSNKVGFDKLMDASTSGPIVRPGECHKVPAIDCTGLSGVDACMMIKNYLVPTPHVPVGSDAGEAKDMECWLTYTKGSNMAVTILNDLAGGPNPPPNKVRIYANWNTQAVYDIPRVYGPAAQN